MVDFSKLQWNSAKKTGPLAPQADDAEAQIARWREYERRSQTVQRVTHNHAVEENNRLFSRMKG